MEAGSAEGKRQAGKKGAVKHEWMGWDCAEA
jgi:hypothetical protein